MLGSEEVKVENINFPPRVGCKEVAWGKAGHFLEDSEKAVPKLRRIYWKYVREGQ